MCERQIPSPLLSICIPAYNRPMWFSRAISSILTVPAEQRSRIEIIISDDSTSAACEEVADTLMQHWEGPYQYKANSPALGMAANWNRCIEMASGTYILILHDDDYLEADAPRKILQALEKHYDSPAFLFGVNIVNTSGAVQKQQVVELATYLNPKRALTSILTNSSFVRFPGMVVKKDVFTQVGNFNETIGGVADIDMWVRVCSRYGLLCVPSVTANYTVHANALTMNMFTIATVKRIESIFEHVRGQCWLPANQLEICRANYLHQFILAGTVRFIRQRKIKDAQATFRLFEQIDIQQSSTILKWRVIRLTLSALVTLVSIFTFEQRSNEVEQKDVTNV